MGKVIGIGGDEVTDEAPREALEEALKADLSRLVVVGVTHDGYEFIQAANMDAEEMNWLLDSVKFDLQMMNRVELDDE